jgi:hypothetical protein
MTRRAAQKVCRANGWRLMHKPANGDYRADYQYADHADHMILSAPTLAKLALKTLKHRKPRTWVDSI